MPIFVITAPDGTEYEVEGPEGATEQDALAQVQASLGAQQPEPVNRLARAGNAVALGVTDAVAEAVGALPDLSAAGARAVGLPAPKDPSHYTNAIKSGFRFIGKTVSDAVGAKPAGGSPEPENMMERGLYGVGHGVTDAAAMVVPAAAVERATRAGTVTNRVARALATQPAVQAGALAVGEGVGEATESPLLGAATTMAAPVAGALARRVVTPFPSQLTPEKARLARVAQKEGIPLTPGQETGSRNLQATESVLGQLPGSGGMTAAENQTQRVAFNRAVLKRAGIQADHASPDVLDAAGAALSKEFEQISGATTVRLDQNFQNALNVVEARYGRKLPSQVRAVFDHYVKDIRAVGSAMGGDRYQVTRSDLGRQAKAAMTNDPFFGQALKGLQSALDDAMVRSVAPQHSKQYADLRQRYAAYKVIMKTMESASTGAAGGDISPAQLWTSVKAQNPAHFPRGKGELNDLARIGQAFVKDQVPDSGTAQRAWLQNLLTGGGLGGGSAVGYASGDPMAGMAVAAGTLAMPAVVKKAMSTAAGRAYLKNQLMALGGPKMTPELAAALLARVANSTTEDDE